MSGSSGPTTAERLFPPTPESGEPRARWYRRRAFLVFVGVVAVVGAAVITDLPTHTSRATDIRGETTVIGEINADVAPCVFAVREALTLYSDETSGTLSSGNRSQIPALLRDDQNACSFTDSSIFDLSNIEVPGSPAGKHIGEAVNTVTVWATSDALGAIEVVQTLTSRPTDRKARAQLLVDERLLAQDRAKATAEINAAGRTLRTRLPALNLSKEALPTPRPPTTP
jgi:hypothetical protein